MTKVTILGESEAPEPKKKIKFVCEVGSILKKPDNPNDWDNIQLISREYIDGMDLMACWNDGAKTRLFVYGYFNDGII